MRVIPYDIISTGREYYHIRVHCYAKADELAMNT